jgi:hypothetical protein
MVIDFGQLRRQSQNNPINLLVEQPTNQSVYGRRNGFFCDSHWKDFREIWYRGLLRISVEKIQIWLQLGKKSGTSHENRSTFYCCQQH